MHYLGSDVGPNRSIRPKNRPDLIADTSTALMLHGEQMNLRLKDSVIVLLLFVLAATGFGFDVDPIGGGGIGGFGVQSCNPGPDGVINVKNCGAVGDDIADDTAAIQKAINVACTLGNGTYNIAPSVFIPATMAGYRTSLPLIINCSKSMHIWGAGRDSTIIRPGARGYPVFFIEPATYISAMGTRSCNSLATGTGASMCWTQSQGYFYSLTDSTTGLQNTPTSSWSNPAPLNGQAAYTLQVYIKYTGAGVGGANGEKYYVVSSSGQDQSTTATITNAIDLYWTQTNSTNGTLTGCYTTTVSGHACATSGALLNGTAYYALLSYDGSDVNLATGRLGGATTTVSTAATGTIVQPAAQSFLLGDLGAWGGSPFAFGGAGCCSGGYLSNHWIGSIDSVDFERAAVTIPGTAPTAKFTVGSNTQLLIDGLAFPDAFLETEGIPGFGAGGYIPAYYYQALQPGTELHQISGLSIADFNSYGIEIVGGVFGTLDNLRLTGAAVAELKLWFTSYGWRINNVQMSTASYAQANAEFVNRAYLVNMSETRMSGAEYGLVASDSGGKFTDIYNLVGANQLVGFWFGPSNDQYSVYNISNLGLDAESGGSTIPVVIAGGNSYKFSDTDFYTNQAVNTIPAIVVNGNWFINNVDIVNSHAELGASAPEIVDIISSTHLLNPVTWQSGVVDGEPFATTAIPLSNDMGHFLSLPLGNPCVTVANLPTPMRAGQTQCITNWNGSTGTCTAGASGYHQAIWDGNNWKC
jgi:hypothetical protein